MILLLPATWAVLLARRLQANNSCTECLKTILTSCYTALDATQAVNSRDSQDKPTATVSSIAWWPLRGQQRRRMSSVGEPLPVENGGVCETQQEVQQRSYSRQPRYSFVPNDIGSDGNKHASVWPDDSSQSWAQDHTDLKAESPAAYVRARYRSMTQSRQQVAHAECWPESNSLQLTPVDRWAEVKSSHTAHADRWADSKTLQIANVDRWSETSSSHTAHADRWADSKTLQIANVDRWSESSSSHVAHADRWAGSRSSHVAHVDRWPKSKSSRSMASRKPPHTRQPRQVSRGQCNRLIASCITVQELQQIVQQHSRMMDEGHLAACSIKLVRLRHNTSEQHAGAARGSISQLLQQLCKLLQPRLQQCSSKQLCSVIWAVCKLQRPCSTASATEFNMTWQSLQQLMDSFVQQLSNHKPQHISMVLYSAASVGYKLSQQHVQQMLMCLLQNTNRAKPQAFSISLWAAARMRHQIEPDLLQQYITALADKLQASEHAAVCKPQAIVNVLWALATMRQSVPADRLQRLVDVLMRQAQAQQLNPLDVRITLWALDVLGQPLQRHQLQHLLHVLDSVTPRPVASTTGRNGAASAAEQAAAAHTSLC